MTGNKDFTKYDFKKFTGKGYGTGETRVRNVKIQTAKEILELIHDEPLQEELVIKEYIAELEKQL